MNAALIRSGVTVRDMPETSPDDAVILAGLRRRDEAMFTAILRASYDCRGIPGNAHAASYFGCGGQRCSTRIPWRSV